MTQHTQGPWLLDGQTVYALNDDRLQCNIFSCRVDQGRNNGRLTPENELIANAHLISAAPDLLEALIELSSLEVKGHSLLDRLQFSTEGRTLSDKITKAIAKAKGES